MSRLSSASARPAHESSAQHERSRERGRKLQRGMAVRPPAKMDTAPTKRQRRKGALGVIERKTLRVWTDPSNAQSSHSRLSAVLFPSPGSALLHLGAVLRPTWKVGDGGHCALGCVLVPGPEDKGQHESQGWLGKGHLRSGGAVPTHSMGRGSPKGHLPHESTFPFPTYSCFHLCFALVSLG